MKRAPWYIWFSIFAYIILIIDTHIRIARHSSKCQDAAIGSPSLQSKATKSFWTVGILVLVLPTLAFMLFLILLENIFGIDSIWARMVDTLPPIFFYLAGICATYRYALWRTKNIPHLLGTGQ